MTVLSGRRLKLAELWARPGRTAFPDWAGEPEPSLSVELRLLLTSPSFAEERRLVVDVGLHAVARCFERGRPNDEQAVLRDLKALADRYRAAVAAGGDFEIAVKSGGSWRGEVTRVKGEPVLAVRTFVG
jgi:hypothetical protein